MNAPAVSPTTITINSNTNDTTSSVPIAKVINLDPVPISTVNSSLAHKYNTMDRLILDATLPILQKFIPVLTVSVFETYNKRIQWELAEAASHALYLNTKRSQMTMDVSKIIDEEESVKAPILKSIINLGVKNEVANLRKEISHLNEKCRKASDNLKKLKEEGIQEDNTSHPKERANDKIQTTTAQSKGTSKDTTRRHHLHQNKTWSRNPSLSRPQKGRMNTSKQGSITTSAPTVAADPISSPTSLKSDQERERKRLRNQRQRANRTAKKRARREDQDAANNALNPPVSPTSSNHSS